MATRGWGWGNREMPFNGNKVSVMQLIGSRNLLYDTVPIVKNTILYTGKFEGRSHFKCSCHNKKKIHHET